VRWPSLPRCMRGEGSGLEDKRCIESQRRMRVWQEWLMQTSVGVR
jgi:hypothetical protein